MEISSFNNFSQYSIKRQSPEKMLQQYMKLNNCDEATAKSALESQYGAPSQNESIFNFNQDSNYDMGGFDMMQQPPMGRMPMMPQMNDNQNGFMSGIMSKIQNFFTQGPQKEGDFDPTREAGVIGQQGPQNPGDPNPFQNNKYHKFSMMF